MYRVAFPDLRMDAEDVLASGDKVVRAGLGGRRESTLLPVRGSLEIFTAANRNARLVRRRPRPPGGRR